jgi:hypothetical protein
VEVNVNETSANLEGVRRDVSLAQKIGNPFRIATKWYSVSQGSALVARNPGLKVMNAFGVLT